MAEYINREAAIERLKRRRDSERFPKTKYAGLESAIFQIKHIPTVDVVEVRHGEWAGDAFCDVLTCKECSYEHALYVLGKLSATNYCPNCGAKMDGKGDTDG